MPRKKVKALENSHSNSVSNKKHENFNNLNIEKEKKPERGFSAKIIEKMAVKRKSAVSTNTSQR